MKHKMCKLNIIYYLLHRNPFPDTYFLIAQNHIKYSKISFINTVQMSKPVQHGASHSFETALHKIKLSIFHNSFLRQQGYGKTFIYIYIATLKAYLKCKDGRYINYKNVWCSKYSLGSNIEVIKRARPIAIVQLTAWIRVMTTIWCHFVLYFVIPLCSWLLLYLYTRGCNHYQC